LNGQATGYGWDPAGRLTSRTNANLEVTQFGYDAAGDLIRLQDGRGNTTEWAYDPYGRAIAKTNANQAVIWSNGYNANGWLVNSWTPAKGLAAMGYDANGNQTSLAVSGISLSRQFDGLNRLTQVDANNIRVKFNYVNFGAFQGAVSAESSQPISGALDGNDALRAVAYGYSELWVRRRGAVDQRGRKRTGRGGPAERAIRVWVR
jgi:YD repeat-containing protein